MPQEQTKQPSDEEIARLIEYWPDFPPDVDKNAPEERAKRGVKLLLDSLAER